MLNAIRFNKNKTAKLIIYISPEYISVAVSKSKFLYHANKFLSKQLDFYQQFREFIVKIPVEYRSYPALIVLASEYTILRNIKTPTTGDNVGEMLYWELVKLYSSKLEQYYWDYKHIGGVVEDNIKKQNYKVELASITAVDSIIKILTESKFKILSVISEETAIENLINYNKPQAESFKPYLLIQLDFNSTVLMLVDNDTVKYKRSIDNISNAIGRTASSFFKEENADIAGLAERMHIMPYSQPEGAALDVYIDFSTALKNIFRQIIEEIRKTENFLKTNYRIGNIENIFITGVYSRINGLTEFLKTEINRNCERYNAPLLESIAKEKSAIFYSAAFLNEREHIRLNINTNKTASSIGIPQIFSSVKFKILALVCVLTMLILPSIFSAASKRAYNDLLKYGDELRLKNEELEKFLGDQNVISVNKKFKTIIESNDYDYRAVIGAIGNSISDGMSIQKLQIRAKDNEPAGRNLVLIEGWCVAPENIPAFILNLDKTKLFQNISLDNSRREPYKSYYLFKFEISAVLKEANYL